jgi:hypothetical protein
MLKPYLSVDESLCDSSKSEKVAPHIVKPSRTADQPRFEKIIAV